MTVVPALSARVFDAPEQFPAEFTRRKPAGVDRAAAVDFATSVYTPLGVAWCVAFDGEQWVVGLPPAPVVDVALVADKRAR